MDFNVLHEYACTYAEMGLSIIPVNKINKLPALKWAEFQGRYPTGVEIDSWFGDSDNNIGIVTGRLSGITVVDCDSEDANAKFLEIFTGDTPCVKTPKGYHYYFRYAEGIRNKVRVRGLAIDIRGEGGFVVCPPTRLGGGKEYKWIKELSRMEDLATLPREIATADTSYDSRTEEKSEKSDFFSNGRRDEDLFHLAVTLLRGGVEEDFAIATMNTIAEQCGFPLSQVRIKLDSAKSRMGIKEKTVTEKVHEYVDMSSGEFTTREVVSDLKLSESNLVVQILKKMESMGILKKEGKRNGVWRRIENNIIEMDWRNAKTDLFGLKLPLRIDETIANIYPKSVVVVAGASNSGKTAFLLETVRLNQKRHKVTYMNSEMGNNELKIRLEKFGEVCKLDQWNFKAIERNGNWADVIDPTGVNIIDYLEIHDEFYLMNQQIAAIYDKLTTGVAVIAIQKKKGADFSVGGEMTMTKPRLYLAMDFQKIKVVKCKDFKGENPNGKVLNFKLYDAWKFIPDRAGWTTEKDAKYGKYGASKPQGTIEDDDTFIPED